MPYVLTNCHNSLCAVGGTINEDDHLFGLSAAKKYGGIYVPPHLAVIHQYMREMYAGCGKMILGSDSHTRYGALGTMAIGEGGGELAKQLLSRTYDVARPGVVAVYLTGSARTRRGPPGRGPGHHRRGVQKRLCEEQGHGVCGPRRGQPAAGIPQRHRRDDHRDHLPVQHLGAPTRAPRSIWPSTAAEALSSPGPGGRGLLRRRGRGGSLHKSSP